ncbi:hypothetical protein SETIT_8G051300v2 [Setaria italica]|uniref:DUF4220 domain-containing protein n=1 Tax=Setaria italica TaxID=4555 RepID=K3ZLP1_SETIT|nr:uncharacterized protein LOC101779169 [Setaria italica]RCV37293.1 hypothetical protein SETIT_8G051300v2 [Setaria italica]RCV37294.1 hypothetical protein SETIT_8G051300v2 [Setaria italica]
MLDVGAAIASLFIVLKTKIYVLIRIEFLVALVTVMFLATFIMDIYRFRSRSSTLSAIMEIVDGMSNQILVYLLGAMQSACSENPLFAFWGILLVSFHRSLGYLSRHSIMDDSERPSLMVLPDVIKFIAAGAMLNLDMGIFTNPHWWFLVILQLRSTYRYLARNRALKSLWHGRSSEFLPEYLRRMTEGDHDDRRNEFNHFQRYLVYGEYKGKLKIKKPQYVLHLDMSHHPDSLITLDKIWNSSGPLLSSSSRSSTYKDFSLAFALSRLLRCRLEDVPLHPGSISRTRNLIISQIIGDQHAEAARAAGRSFRILELELAFTIDYYFTFYPMVFWRGLLSLSLILIQSMATIPVIVWLVVSVCSSYDNEKGRITRLRVGGFDVGVVTTWVFLILMVFKEVWEMVTYLLSNWTRLLLVCKYVQSQCWRTATASTSLIEHLISSFFASKISDTWHGRIDQYEFLQSCTYKPTVWKLAHIITLGVAPDILNGRKPGAAIRIPECVKPAILQGLRRQGLTRQPLRRDIPTLRNPPNNNRFVRYQWACIELPTCSQVILVWHIATSLCEVKLAKDRNIDLRDPSFLGSIWSYLGRKLGRSSSFLVDDSIHVRGQLRTNYRTASSLSRYCAYLLVFRSKFLPDGFLTPKLVLDKTIKHACEALKDCDSTLTRYETLMATARNVAQDSESGKLNMNIVQQGAMLAMELIDEEDEQNRWEILAGVWVDLLVHIAPSWNAEAHVWDLQSGGEFITLIWVLLWHCGIEKSSLWHEDDNASGNNSPQALQQNGTETRQTNNVTGDEQVINEDGIEISEEPEQLTERAQRASKTN